MSRSGTIGVDESGKGDYFGPLVVAACYVGPEHLAELEGVKDSKKLTDAVIAKLEPVIRRVCPHAVITIGPTKYNELYAKIGNLNKLLAWGHARAIENVLGEVDCEHVISDQFADPAGLKRALMERGRKVTLESKVRAESEPSVAAASILARAEFVRRLARLGQEIGTVLPKGAGTHVLETGVALVRSKGETVLSSVAKTHFKTTKDVLERV